MRNDTKTFLSAVLGIPLVLGGVWGINAANETSVVVFQREHVATGEAEIPKPIDSSKEVAVTASVAPVASVPKPNPTPVKVVVQPVAVPSPVVTPVVAPVIETPPVEPTPKPVVVKKSRRTRAS